MKHGTFFDAFMKPTEGFANLNLNAQVLFNISASIADSTNLWKILKGALDLTIAFRDTFEEKGVQLVHHIKVLSGGVLSNSIKTIALTGLERNPLPVKMQVRDRESIPLVKVLKIIFLRLIDSLADIVTTRLEANDLIYDEIRIPDLVVLPPIVTKLIHSEKIQNSNDIAREPLTGMHHVYSIPLAIRVIPTCQHQAFQIRSMQHPKNCTIH